jgi:Fe-S cluster biogenesis protein NfuA
MFIESRDTPNPASIQFLPGRAVAPGGSVFYESAAEAQQSPLALVLFKIEGVGAVFFGADFITVTKKTDASWDYLKVLVLSAIMDHFLAGLTVFMGEAATDAHDDDDPIVLQIKEVLTRYVRPSVAQDGGDIVFNRFEDGILFLEMHGACAGCPSSTATLKNGIENMMKHYVPEVTEVRAA